MAVKGLRSAVANVRNRVVSSKSGLVHFRVEPGQHVH